ncbi:MAG: ferritin family protein [Candidatus Cryosericum sp.]|nr:ferritin family protein [bacterium]
MSNEGMITLLKDAFQLEVEGWLFYRDVIGTLSEGPVRDVFVYLMDQEAKHQEFIKQELDRVEADTPIELSGLSALKETAHEEVLADAVRSSKDLSQHEASAIHTGMLLERNSWEFYHRAAERATQPDETSLYTQLEEWEKVHLHVLEKAYDLLKERIWAENRFAPF